MYTMSKIWSTSKLFLFEFSLVLKLKVWGVLLSLFHNTPWVFWLISSFKTGVQSMYGAVNYCTYIIKEVSFFFTFCNWLLGSHVLTDQMLLVTFVCSLFCFWLWVVLAVDTNKSDFILFLLTLPDQLCWALYQGATNAVQTSSKFCDPAWYV